MRRSLMAFVYLLTQLIAVFPADAKYLNRNPAIGNDSANGLSPQTAWRTVEHANANLSADSTIWLAANDTLYDAPIDPVNARTTWRGDSTNWRAVKIPGASLNTTANTFIGLSFWGGVTMNDSQYENGRAQHFRKCGLYGFVYAKSSGQFIYGCEIGSSSVPNRTQLYINPGFSNGDSIRIIGNTMFLKNDEAEPGDFLLRLQPDRWHASGQPTDKRTMRAWTFTDNACTLTTVLGQALDKVTMFNSIVDSRIGSNSFLWRDSSGITNGATQAFCVRDSFSRNLVDLNTFEFRTLIEGTGNSVAKIYSSGSFLPDSGNVWRDNVFKSNVSPGGGSASAAWEFHWKLAARDSIIRNTFISNTYLAAASFGNSDSRDSAFVRHNLFANLAGGPALVLDIDDDEGACLWNSGARVDLRGNIFYAPLTTDGAFRMNYTSAEPEAIYSNYNLFWTPRDASRAHWIGNCLSSLAPVTVGSHATYDVNSTHGCPVFADSSYATFDPTMACNSAAEAAGPWSGHAGPKAYDASLCAPSPVTDLRVIGATSKSVVLEWTAPGSVADEGQAQLYSLRYSTSAITANNFADADTVTFPAIYYPREAGSSERATVSGLTANTTYYFALKALGSEGIYSGISNVPSFTTRKAGTAGGHLEP